MAKSDSASIFLWPAPTSPRVHGDERLTIRPFSVLVLHVRVQRRVGKVGFIAVIAFVVSSLGVILRSTFLLLFLAIFI